MTTYTDEVNIYNPDAISDAIDDAGNAYKSVITEVGSTGVKIHPSGQSGSGIVDYTLIDDDGMEVFEGGDSVAQFGSTSRIGKASGRSHMELDYHSMQLVDKEGDAYFHVSDLREADGSATIVETFVGDGQSILFTVQMPVSEEVSVVDSSHATNPVTAQYGSNYALTYAPDSGATVTITYKTTSQRAKAYTLGLRDGNSHVGSLSVAEGLNTISSGLSSHAEGSYAEASGRDAHAEGSYTEAKGDRSHAQNRGTIAASNDQTVIGKYNIASTYANVIGGPPDYALIIGNGISSIKRSNALAVDWDGGVDLWTPHIDMTTAPSNAVYDRMLEVFDKNGNPIGWFQVSQGTNNSHAVVIGASNSDDSVHNQLHLSFDANDDPNAWISHPVPFRNALGASSGIWPVDLGGTGASTAANARNNLGASSGIWPISIGGTGASSAANTTTVSSVITAGSGVSITSVSARRWGPICVLEIIAEPTADKSGTWTVGTLKSGFVPLNQVTASEWGGGLQARIATTGVISAYGSRSKNSNFSIGATYFWKSS